MFRSKFTGVLLIYVLLVPVFSLGQTQPKLFEAPKDVFEKIRAEEFPDKPSRLKSIFLCESPGALKQFLTDTKRAVDLAYEVTT